MSKTDLYQSDGPPRAPAERWLQRASLTLLSLVAMLLGWIAVQFIDVRDAVHELKAAVPLQIAELDRRVTINEAHIVDLYQQDRSGSVIKP